MEGLRSEVSQKIKKAIQAKLIELGVTIAEELPDYIMVLVVNKKSKKQMEDDLVLFLQGKTTIFVEWLLEILGRLQTMSMHTKEKAGKAVRQLSRQEVAAHRDSRKRSPPSGQSETGKRSRPDCTEPAPAADPPAGQGSSDCHSTPVATSHSTTPTAQQPADGERPPTTAPGHPASLDSPGQQSAASRDSPGQQPAASRDSPGQQPAASRDSPGQQPAASRDSPGQQPAASRDSPGQQPAASRDSPQTGQVRPHDASKSRSKPHDSSKSRRSKSRDSPKSRRSKSRDSSRSRRSESRDSSKSRRSKSRDSSRSRRSESRDSSKSRRSKSRDSSRSRRSKSRDSSGSRRSQSRDSSRSRRSKSRDSSRSCRSKSRDSPKSRRSESRDREKRRGSLEGAGGSGSRGSAGGRHPRISFTSAAKGDRRSISSGEEPATDDPSCRRVPLLHGGPPTTAGGGRIINLREESSFPPAGRSVDQQTADARRGPQSSVSSVRRRPPAENSEDSEEEGQEDRPRGAVASTVRVTDRPRPPAHLLPRPAILVKAMRDAQQSTGSAGRGARRRRHGTQTKPAASDPAAGRKASAPFVGDLRAKLAAARQPESRPQTAGLAGTKRSSRSRRRHR